MADLSDVLLDIKSQEASTRLLPVTIFVVVLMVLGFTGNGLACVYYSCKVKRTQTTNLILFISVLDEITSISIPRTIVILMYTYKYENSTLCKMDAYATYILVSFSILVLVVLAVTRYRLVCQASMTKFTDKQVLIGIGVSMLFALAVCSPCLVMYEAVPITLDVQFNSTLTNVTGHYCGQSKMKHLNIFKRVVNGVHFLCILVSFITLIVIYYKIRQKIKQQDRKLKVLHGKPSFKSYLNEVTVPAYGRQTDDIQSNMSDLTATTRTLQVPAVSTIETSISGDYRTINEDTDYVYQTEYTETTANPTENLSNTDDVTVIRKKKRRRRAKSTRKRLSTVARQQTLLIFVVTVTFMVSMLPYFIKSVFESFPVGKYDVGKLWIQFCYRSYLINSAVNPFLYSFFNQPFREFVYDAFCFLCTRCKKRQNALTY